MDTGLVFGIIFAAIVVSLLVFFGFRYINEMVSVTCESQIGQEITDIRSAVRATLSLSRGSSQELRLVHPSCLRKICFVDAGHPEIENAGAGWEPTEFTTDLVSRYKYSVLLFRPDGGIEGHAIDKFGPSVNFCVSSTKDVVLRNTGTAVEIAPLQQLPEF